VTCESFVPPGQRIPEALSKSVRRTLAHERCDAYLALVDGRPADGGTVETAGEIACLFGTGVTPEFRRRGVQQALIAERLERVRERRGRLACIQSRPGIATERNAARLGFFTAYHKIVMAMPRDDLERSP